MSNNNMDRLLWIVDNWVNSEGESSTTEHWEKISDSLYTGGSETIKNGEIVFSEKLKIQKTGDDIFYIADVSHNPVPVMFKLTFINDSLAVFENPEHDFPKKISYQNKNGSLLAWIEGPGENGELKKIDFYFNKKI